MRKTPITPESSNAHNSLVENELFTIIYRHFYIVKLSYQYRNVKVFSTKNVTLR